MLMKGELPLIASSFRSRHSVMWLPITKIGAIFMPALAPFTPGNSVAVSVTASSAYTGLSVPKGDQIMVTSPSANAIAFIAFGISTTTVTIPTTSTNGCPILPGTVQVFTVPPGTTGVSVIGSTSSTLYFTAGDGI